jgi:hypothetical protein
MVGEEASPQASDGGGEDRRIDNYTFTTERDLVAFFRQSLPDRLIRRTIKSIKDDFVRRSLSTQREGKLQYLKKCEIELVRLSREQLGIGEG